MSLLCYLSHYVSGHKQQSNRVHNSPPLLFPVYLKARSVQLSSFHLSLFNNKHLTDRRTVRQMRLISWKNHRNRLKFRALSLPPSVLISLAPLFDLFFWEKWQLLSWIFVSCGIFTIGWSAFNLVFAKGREEREGCISARGVFLGSRSASSAVRGMDRCLSVTNCKLRFLSVTDLGEHCGTYLQINCKNTFSYLQC